MFVKNQLKASSLVCFQVPVSWFFCELFTFSRWLMKWADTRLFCQHKTYQTHYDRLHFPYWIPWLGMPVTNRQTDTNIRLKTTTWSEHYHGGGLKGVLIWKLKDAVVVPSFIWPVFKIIDAVVPVEKVIWIRLCNVIRVGVSKNILMFFHKTFGADMALLSCHWICLLVYKE